MVWRAINIMLFQHYIFKLSHVNELLELKKIYISERESQFCVGTQCYLVNWNNFFSQSGDFTLSLSYGYLNSFLKFLSQSACPGWDGGLAVLPVELSWPVIIGLRGHKVQTFPSLLRLPVQGHYWGFRGIRCPETGRRTWLWSQERLLGEKQLDKDTNIHACPYILTLLGETQCNCLQKLTEK